MKIDKRNYRHWMYLTRSAFFITISIVLRCFVKRGRRSVVLYGHKYNGNLKAYAEYYARQQDPGFDLYFLSLDPNYAEELTIEEPGLRVLSMHKLRDMVTVGLSSIIITDHGVHALMLYLYFTKIKFIDVWHGVPFKGYPARNFELFQRYYGVWVSSAAMKEVYRDRFAVQADKLIVTGYSRVDAICRGDFSVNLIKRKYGISDKFSYVIIFAPTWKQDDKGRSILPYGMSGETFFGELDALAKKLNGLIIFRAHLNSGDAINIARLHNIKFMPYSKYPVAEEFLYIADLLVSDWSSIVFDYLPLDRPTLFLDVPAPFKDGFTLDPSYRFGDTVGSFAKLRELIELYVSDPGLFVKKHQQDMVKAKNTVYGKTLDGLASQRYHQQLVTLLGSGKK